MILDVKIVFVVGFVGVIGLLIVIFLVNVGCDIIGVDKVK